MMIASRPALVAAFVMGGGIFAAKYFSIPWQGTLFLSLALLLIALFSFYRNRRTQGRERMMSLSIPALLFVVSAASFSVNDQLVDDTSITRYLSIADSVRITCTVADEPRVKEGKTRMLVQVVSLSREFDTVAVSGKAYLTILPNKRINEQPKEIPYGSILSFTGILRPPGDERNPGEFSYREYLALNNIYGMVSVYGYANVTIAEERNPHWFFEYIIFPSKNFIVKSITTVMSGDEANFLIGLLLGDRTDISEEIKNAFMNTGTIHVLAVSGSHVILVVTIVYVILGVLRFPKKIKIITTLFVLIYYTFLTGAAPSIVRASVMAGIVLVGKYIEQKTDVYNVLGLSAVLIFLYDPKQLFDVGFQLSFSAVFSMVYFFPKLNSLVKKIPEPLEEFRIITPVWQLFAVSLAAQIGTIPFTAYYFGKISIISLFANLLVVPAVGIIVTIGLTGAVLGTVTLWFAALFSEVNSILAWGTLTFVKLAEQVPYAIIYTATFGWKETMIYCAVIGMLFNIRNVRVVKRILLVTMAAANIVLYASLFDRNEPRLTVTFLDVGQGDCAVIQFPSGQTFLIDGGPITAGFNAGEKIVAPFLRRNGISRIDAMITTHPHADHLGGVPYLMRSFDVVRTVDSDQMLGSRLFREYEALEKNVTQVTARAGMMETIGNARLYYLHPTEAFIDHDSSDGYSNINEVSVVCKIVYGTTSFLFMGDAETESEHHMVSLYGDFLDSDVIKAGHHGSSTSSSDDLVSAVTPDHVVISVARFNKFKHPSRFVLDRYSVAGSMIHRTDTEGAIIFASDGTNITYRQWRRQ